MKKHAIECSSLLLKWTGMYSGEQCSHVFTDVIVRGGPKIIYETVASSQRRCVGRYFVTTERRVRWEWLERPEFVWEKRVHEAQIERLRVVYKCPECGEKEASAWFEGPPIWVKPDALEQNDEIPF